MSARDRERVTVRVVNNHPATSKREYITFKNIQRKNVVFTVAAASIALFRTTSMVKYEQQRQGRWVRIGPVTTEAIKAEVKRLGELWHPLDELKKPIGGEES